jgi:hypothetical protein
MNTKRNLEKIIFWSHKNILKTTNFAGVVVETEKYKKENK